MRHHRLAWIAAAALTVAPFSPAATHAVAAVPARALAPADVATPAVVKHVNTDVDGDGTRDSVNLTYLGSNNFELAATTTKGQTAKVAFSSHVDPSADPPADTFYGADAIDGHKGSELIMNLFPEDFSVSGVSRAVAVYTWRSGALVAETAPAAPSGTGWEVGLGEGSESVSGYWFFTSHGHRYVDTSRLAMGEGPWWYTGSVTRSVWGNDGWVKVSTRTARAKSLTWKQVGMAGPKLLLDQVRADVSGDGRADLVLFYRVGIDHCLVTVLAHGHSATIVAKFREVRFIADLLIGAAAVDGVPGEEVIINTGRPEWTVLAWRHGGKLVRLRAPALYGKARSSSTWNGRSGEVTNFALSVESGRHYVVTGRVRAYSDLKTEPVRFARSVWAHGHWTKLTQWTAVLTDEQRSAFHDGFTASDLVTP